MEAVEEVPCDKECTDTDGDGLIDHVEECAYTPTVEGQPCAHVHGESCGGVIVEQTEKETEVGVSTEDAPDPEKSLRELIALLNEPPDPMACLAQGSILDRDQLAKARAAVDSWFAGEEEASSGSEEEREQLAMPEMLFGRRFLKLRVAHPYEIFPGNADNHHSG